MSLNAYLIVAYIAMGLLVSYQATIRVVDDIGGDTSDFDDMIMVGMVYVTITITWVFLVPLFLLWLIGKAFVWITKH